MKKILALLLAVSLVLAACAGPAAAPAAPAPAPAPAAAAAPAPAPEAEAPADEPADEVVFRVGVSLPPILNDFHAVMRTEIENAVANAPDNFDFQIVSAMDANDQYNVLEVLYLEQFDGVVISPFDGVLIAPIAEQIYMTGAPTVIINRAIATDHFTAFVAGDNPGGGRNAADVIGERLGGEGYVFGLRMAAGTPIDADRHNAFMEQLETYWPGITIIGDGDAGNTREGGFNTMQNALQAHPHIDAVFGHCEIAALGAVAAIEQSGREDIQIVTGFGGSLFLVEIFEEEPDFLLNATMSYLPVMGATAIETMIRILNGETVERYVIDPPLILTAENLDMWRDWAY